MVRRWLLAAAWLLIPVLAFAAQVAVPPLRSPVTDLTGTLTAGEAAALEQKLRAFEARKGSQVAVLMVPSTAPETIEQYSIRVAEQWRVGRGQVDDGVILLVAKDDRAVRIEVGYGAEGAIPDVLASRIVNQVVVPRFRQGQFAEGINEAVDRIVALLEGEPLPEAARSKGSEGFGTLLPLLLMFVFVGSGIVRRMFGGLGGASIMGAVAAVIAWALTSAAAVAVVAAVIAFLFTLLGGGGFGGGFGSGMGGWTRGRRGGFGGGGFGGGGGGWSGGGGGFGGGGASGRW